jgi:hypothetical protein
LFKRRFWLPVLEWLLPYGCWDEIEDEEGMKMVYLDVEQVEEGKRSRF